ncbi:hypothetical protein [Acidipropionibacterium acidipropionici]|uniref:hypothetical protein n=1 Tax=Acidipropionibacterium acidipropionici TaxID=1748 RepID=UPI0012B5CA72|nr:hypothetical protein [Acidipropionibacterium acidipropionici]
MTSYGTTMSVYLFGWMRTPMDPGRGLAVSGAVLVPSIGLYMWRGIRTVPR